MAGHGGQPVVLAARGEPEAADGALAALVVAVEEVDPDPLPSLDGTGQPLVGLVGGEGGDRGPVGHGPIVLGRGGCQSTWGIFSPMSERPLSMSSSSNPSRSRTWRAFSCSASAASCSALGLVALFGVFGVSASI